LQITNSKHRKLADNVITANFLRRSTIIITMNSPSVGRPFQDEKFWATSDLWVSIFYSTSIISRLQ
jgi:hypothetical protein